jgi:hypothetical protein
MAYPATLAAANNGNGIKASPGTSYSYIVNNSITPPGFCLTATNGTTTYKVTENTAPTIGDCSTYGLVLSLNAGNHASYPGTGTTWTDLSGNGYNGTLLNGVGYTSANGGTLTFDGVDDYVSESSIPDSFWNAGPWTVSAWVNFAAVNRGTDNAIIGHGSIAVNNGLHLCERGAKVYFGLYGNDLQSNSVLSAGNWYNIVFTLNNSNGLKQIYINGTFDSSGGTIGYGGTGSNTNIGRLPWSPTYIMDGNIANIQLYNRVLSTSEITQNFNTLRSLYGI